MRRHITTAAALTLLLSACGGARVPTGLTGNTYVSESVTGHSLVPGTTISLEFGDGNVAVDAGCNHMSGAASVENDVLHVDVLSSTEMACEPPSRMAQDTWIAQFLTSGPRLDVTGSLFTLSRDGVSIVFVRTSTGDTGVVGVPWQLTSTVTGSGADAVVSSLPRTRTSTVVRLSGRRILVTTPCATVTGDVSVTATTLVLGELTVDGTGHRCAGAKRQVHRAVLSTLSGTATYVIDAGTLTVTAADGTHGLIFGPRQR